MTLSAFFLALLGQIQDKAIAKSIPVAAADSVPAIKVQGDTFVRDVASTIALALFSLRNSSSGNLSEQQFALLLVDVISKRHPDWKINLEPRVLTKAGATLRPDLLIEHGRERVVIELRLADRENKDRHARSIDQLTRYMRAMEVLFGILVWVPRTPELVVGRPIQSRERLVEAEPAAGTKSKIVEIGISGIF